MAMNNSAGTLANADWDNIESELLFKFRCLRQLSQHLHQIHPESVADKIANDLVLPCLELIADFCACVEITNNSKEATNVDGVVDRNRGDVGNGNRVSG